jgi:hypothetical protein
MSVRSIRPKRAAQSGGASADPYLAGHATIRKTRPEHPDYSRIRKRLHKHCDELFTFLDDPAVPSDNKSTERDIRSLAAARSDGGTHRADWSAAAFAQLKSAIVTAMKNPVRLIRYGIELVRAQLRGERLPLPSAATPDTSSPRAGINRPQPGHPVHPHVLGFDGTPAAIDRFRSRALCRSPRPVRPPLPRRFGATTIIVRAGHASSVTNWR